MSNACFTVVDLCAIRVSRLSAAGQAVASATGGYVSDNQVKAIIGLEIEKGAEFTQKNGCGQIITNVKEPDLIKRSTLELDLAKLDFELQWLMLGGTLFSDASSHGIGYQSPKLSDGAPPNICFEAWAKAFDADTQSVPAFTSPLPAYLHFVLPKVQCVQKSITLENGISVPGLTGDGTSNTHISADGPFNDWPSRIAMAGGITSCYGVFEDATFPTAACGFISVPTAS